MADLTPSDADGLLELADRCSRAARTARETTSARQPVSDRLAALVDYLEGAAQCARVLAADAMEEGGNGGPDFLQPVGRDAIAEPVPANAIEAGAAALQASRPEDVLPPEGLRDDVRLIVQAAAPHIRADERQKLYAELGNDHFVIFTEDGWTTEHSVECRLSGQMHRCAWHTAVARIADEFDEDMTGRWLITAIDHNGEPALVRSDLIEEADRG